MATTGFAACGFSLSANAVAVVWPLVAKVRERSCAVSGAERSDQAALELPAGHTRWGGSPCNQQGIRVS